MVDYVNNKENGEFMDASDLEAIETASASKQDKDIGTNSRAIVSGSTGELEVSDTTKAELALLSGLMATTAELNTLGGITSTTNELNILDGVTSTAAELNILDGVTSTTAELNTLGGITSTVSELNILDGVTSTAAELNILDGVTSTTTEINLLSGETNLHPTGTESAQGELQQATTASTITGTATDTATHPAGVKAAIDAAIPALILNTVIVDIGDWDMDANSTKTVAHGVVDYNKIRTVNIYISGDSGLMYNFSVAEQAASTNGYVSVSSSDIYMVRGLGGFFDTAEFNQTSYNRGWITIQYID